MAWCPLYKAGSTSWLYNLCLLAGYSERELRDTKEQLSTLARKAYPELEYPEAEEVGAGPRHPQRAAAQQGTQWRPTAGL